MYSVKTLPEFDVWFDGLKDRVTRLRLARRLDKAQRGILGDVKPVGAEFMRCASFLVLAGACTMFSGVMC
jgi:putative component of toxin-antitoxin plasmid stabilization module